MKKDEEYGPVVLAPLADEKAAPSTVDIPRAIAKARRRKAGRRLTVVGAVIAIGGIAAMALPHVEYREPTASVTPLASTPSASPSPSTTDHRATLSPPPLQPRQPVNLGAMPTGCVGAALPLAKGAKESFATGIDPTGRYAVGRSYPNGGSTPVLWSGNKAITLDLKGNDDWMTGVNSHGVAVGVGNGFGGWVYLDGKLQEVKGGLPVAINDKGQMAGGLQRWETPLGSPIDLPLPPGVSKGSALGIGEDGTIVGLIGEAGTDSRPYLWTAEGRGFLLAAPAYKKKILTNVRAEAISNGWVVGIGWLESAMAVRWDLATGKVQVFPEMEGGQDVNPAGWFSGKGTSGHAVLSDGVRTKTLPDVFGFDKKFGWNVAYGISADGRTLAGTVTDAGLDGRNRAVKWTCQ